MSVYFMMCSRSSLPHASPPAPARRFFYGICKVYRTYWIYKMTDLSYNKKINL